MPSKQEAVRKILETHIVFNRLPIEDLNALEEFFEVEKYQAGDVIVERGEAMDGIRERFGATSIFRAASLTPGAQLFRRAGMIGGHEA